MYSKKFHKIIYVGERKYKSPEIILSDDNWIEKPELNDVL